MGKAQIQCGKAQLGAQSPSVDDPARQRVGAAQHLRRPAEIGLGQRLADEQLEMRTPASSTIGMATTSMPHSAPTDFSRPKSPCRRAPKQKSVPMRMWRACRCSARQWRTKSSAGQPATRGPNGARCTWSDPQTGQHVQPVTQTGDAQGRRPRRLAPLLLQRMKIFARMRFEGQHGCRQPLRAGVGHQRAHQCLVTQVDTVEIADGQRTGLAGAGRGRERRIFTGGIIERVMDLFAPARPPWGMHFWGRMAVSLAVP